MNYKKGYLQSWVNVNNYDEVKVKTNPKTFLIFHLAQGVIKFTNTTDKLLGIQPSKFMDKQFADIYVIVQCIMVQASSFEARR